MAKKNYENFPLSLALFDALPVIFFSVAMVLIAMHFRNVFFIKGAVLCAVSGLGKVVWKIIIAGTKKDISLLNKQLRILMPVGFLLMLIGIIMGISLGTLSLKVLWHNICTFPSLLFFLITLAGMICMSVFAVKLDGTKLRSNWMEQITNAIAQGCFLLGVLFVVL